MAFDVQLRDNGSSAFDISLSSTSLPVVVLDSPTDGDYVSGSSVGLSFTGTDSESDDLEYQIQLDIDNDFSSWLDVNLIENFSFESDPVGYDPPSSYGRLNNVAGCTREVVSDYVYLGGKSLKISAASAVDEGIYQSEGSRSGGAMVIVPGATYRFSGYLKTALTTGQAHFHLKTWDDSYSNGYEFDTTLYYGTNDWTYCEYIFKAATNQTIAEVVCCFGSWGDAAAGSAWFDNLNLERIATINAYSASDSGFSLGHPFASGDPVTYSLTSIISAGTYYWRVRAIDPLGENAWGNWANPISFIVNSKAETLLDNFDDNSIDANIWETDSDSGGSVFESSQRINITPGVSSVGYTVLSSLANYDLAESYVQVNVLQIADPTSTDTHMIVCDSTYTEAYLIVASGGNLYAATWDAGNLASVTYDSDLMAYWRIRETSGVIYFEYSSLGIDGYWTLLHSMSVDSWNIAHCYVQLGTYEWSSTPTPGTAIFEDCNIIYEYSPTVQLNSPSDTSSTIDTTPTLEFTGIDYNDDDIRYQIQVDSSPVFQSQVGTAVTNLIPNPSFENITGGWADNWSRTDSTFTIDTSGEGQAPNATNCLKVVFSGSSSKYCRSTIFNVDYTKTYYFSFILKLTSITSGSIDWAFDEYDSGDSWVSWQYKSYKNSAGVWQITGTYTPTGSSVAKAQLYFLEVTSSTLTAYIDNVQVYEINTDATQPKVSISFDDGEDNVYNNSSIFTSRGIPITQFIISDLVGTMGYQTWSQISNTVNFGWQIGNHTKSHVDLTSLSESQIVSEISTCQSAIISNTGVTPVDIAWPFGLQNALTRQVASRYVIGMRDYSGIYANYAPYETTSIYGKSVENTDSVDAVKGWIDAAVSNGYWVSLVFHGLVASNPSQYQWTVSDMEELLDYINSVDIKPVTIEQGRNAYYTNYAIADAVSGTDSGFSGSPDNSDPFTSGQSVLFTMQSALSLGTYYWRVRGIDPGGSAAYGNWSSAYSFSVISSSGIKVWNGSDWVIKPVKVWNGSDWVIKPVKVWNGTSWEIKS
ncbi:polysaccharide deacetylase family protein [Candidatus Saccharibacteria bacterium]|nr:polysaccharide deacetylase family protein [Candidatus Saccharibacteria bacterium]